jgi:uncharacterized protein
MSHAPSAQRLCPVDHTPLTNRRIRRFGPEVRVDDCGKCGGLFLDRDELFHLTADHALNKRLRTSTHADELSQRLCPHDNARMALEQTRGVEVEVCPKCHGLWLDADELEALNVRELA